MWRTKRLSQVKGCGRLVHPNTVLVGEVSTRHMFAGTASGTFPGLATCRGKCTSPRFRFHAHVRPVTRGKLSRATRVGRHRRFAEAAPRRVRPTGQASWAHSRPRQTSNKDPIMQTVVYVFATPAAINQDSFSPGNGCAASRWMGIVKKTRHSTRLSSHSPPSFLALVSSSLTPLVCEFAPQESALSVRMVIFS